MLDLSVLDLMDISPQFGFGSIVRGLTLAQLDDPEIREALHQAWYDRGLLIFRNGDNSLEFQIELSAVFGPLVKHQNAAKLVDGRPELVKLTANPDEEIVIELDGEIRIGVLPWHADARWLPSPPHGGILRVHQIPATGGETGFMDMIAAYERLPDELKQAIEGRHTVIHLDTDPSLLFKFQPDQPRIINAGGVVKTIGNQPSFPPKIQPLVVIQPQTGRKMLGFIPMPVQQITGLTPEASEALLLELSSYATDETYAYVHNWLEDDLVLWDNFRTLHKSYGIPPGESRELWRTTIGGAWPWR